MRTSITIRPAGMASAVTALAVATMLAACVASTGGPVPGPQEAAGLVQFRAAERAVSGQAVVTEAQSLAAFRAAERAAFAGAAGETSAAGRAQGRFVR
jgi:hypothetical protein